MNNNTIKTLFAQAKAMPYNGSGMMPVPCIKGPGFFPGCTGLIGEFTLEHSKPVMVLGQDFGTQEYHNGLNEDEGEIKMSATWRNIIPLLSGLEIMPEQCFFTNIFPGLREGGKMMGPSRPANNPEDVFGLACRDFLVEELEAIRPQIVFVLGKYPARTLAEWWPESFQEWKGLEGITKPIAKNRLYDYYEVNLCQDVRFGTEDIRFLFALHPSMSNTHRGLIWGKNNNGGAQEVELIKSCLPKSFTTAG